MSAWASQSTPHRTPTDILAAVCDALSAGDEANAEHTLTEGYPRMPAERGKRSYSERESLKLFLRDGFIDRYGGARLVNPGVLRLLSVLLPDAFPAHPNWKMSESHQGFWELFPTVDHVVPIARGGTDDESNWMTCSMLRNSAKAHWTLDELGWHVVPSGDLATWDGLTSWFVRFVSPAMETSGDTALAARLSSAGRSGEYIRRWWRASRDVAPHTLR
ncbi:MAG: HNH endonuclease [Polyangiales bacterium]